VEGKSLLHPHLFCYNMHFNYIIIYLLLASIWWVLHFKVRLGLFISRPWQPGFILMLGSSC
jgi:hypothetical protein